MLEHVLSIDGLPSEQTGVVSSLSRRTVLMPENLLNPLFTWLKECLILLEQNGKLTHLEIWPNMVKLATTVYDSQQAMANAKSATSVNNENRNSSPVNTLSSIATMSPSHAAANLLANGKKVLMNRRGNCYF